MLPRINWPDAGKLEFNNISDIDSNFLVMRFSEGEIKQAMCDYESFKSLGSDVLNFGFIKEISYT